MTLLQAEWMRLVRGRAGMVATSSVLALLLGSAVDAGVNAARYRHYVDDRHQQWAERLQGLRTDKDMVNPPSEAAGVASAVFEFGRTEAPVAPRAAGEGLALSVRQFISVPGDVRVTLESRYVDSRKTEVIENPLLSAMGVPDLSVVVALLVPLLVIALTYGLVLEAREQGVWRFVLAQTPKPWLAFSYALGLRFVVVVAVVAIASAAAFSLDPGASFSAWLAWMLAVSICAASWIGIAALFSMVRLSSTTAVISLLVVWLLTSFAAPVVLSSYAAWRIPSESSQLATLRKIRELQQDSETRESELLQRWYADHPEHVPKTINTHTFPVTFVPRYLEQDRHIAPIMRAFDEQRSRRAELIRFWAATAPGFALVLFGDQLAGTSPQQQSAYLFQIAELEQRWRDVLLGAVMSYRGLSESDVVTLETLHISDESNLDLNGVVAACAFSTFVLGLAALLRRSLLSP